MLALALLLAAADEDLPARLRHLESAAAAWAPAPSSDGTRIAFLTTLFKTRQAASVAVDGSYPTQLTDEPGGVVEIRYVPFEPGQLVAVGLRDGRRRILRVDEEGGGPTPVDPAAGDQILGGFSRDGKKLFYAVLNGAAVFLRSFAMDGEKTAEIGPPPPEAGRSTMGVDAVTVQDRSRKTVHAPAGNVEAFAVTDDGHRLAVAVESNGQDVFSLLDIPSLRVQPLAVPPSGALADGGLIWDRTGERLFFGWRLSDDMTDVWQLRTGRGTPLRLTRSPRPGLRRDEIPRPSLVHAGDGPAWLWRPPQGTKPRVAVLIAAVPTRPVFDQRIAAVNFAGLAVLAVNGQGAQKAALAYL